MLSDTILLLALASSTLSMPVQQLGTSGFTNPVQHKSNGGDSSCVSGTVSITTSAQNTDYDFAPPVNRTEVTQTMLDFITTNSSFPFNIVSSSSPKTVSSTFQIGATFCSPTTINPPSRVQLLTHGLAFDRSYWDFAPGYSYVEAVTATGDAVFFYDRLGVGASNPADSPLDPINTIQAKLELSIASALAGALRKGVIGNIKFRKVIGVGHSFGSVLTLALTAIAPTALDATILTGFSLDLSALPTFWLGSDLQIAAQNVPARFSTLNNGYLVGESLSTAQQTFFSHTSNFSPAVLQRHEDTKATISFGEIFTAKSIVAIADGFHGPVAVVNGDDDLPFCGGNCTYLFDQAETAQAFKEYYPNANGSTVGTFLVPDAGHALNLHYNAGLGFSYIGKFLKGV